ncbi:MAG: hypothetical protein HYS13_21355 [Planctomycetia bacterium]|nr:hypothetical protein [Planctomycetia bacterium]
MNKPRTSESHTVFYSWQSDLPNSTNRSFIEDCLERAIKELRADEHLKLDPCLDRDTSGVPGSPDIAATIFEKIKAADIFVGDVSFINQEATRRRTPNPNVLVELGYAACSLGWHRIICVFNRATGSINELPFDIRQRRVRNFELTEGQDKAEQRKILASVLTNDIKGILHAPDKEAAQALERLLSDLASELISVIIIGSELEDRKINPWADAMRLQLQSSADALRNLATTDTQHSMAAEVEDLANVLEEAATMRMHLGSGPELASLVERAVAKATAIKTARIDGVPLSETLLSQLRSTLTAARRQLDGLASRAENMANQSRLDDLQSKASQIGHTLLQVGHYNIDELKSGLGEQVRAIGRDLHLVETMSVYCDGGRSVAAIVERVRQNAGVLGALVGGLG